MKRYAVIREENGKQYMKDEDVIQAHNYTEAELKIRIGQHSGHYDNTCRVHGEIVDEIDL